MTLPLTLTLPRTVTRTLTLTSRRPHPRGGLLLRRVRTLRDRTRYLLRQLLALRRLRQTHGLRAGRSEEWGDRRDRAQVAFDVSSRRGAGRRARAPHHRQWLGVCRFGHVAILRLSGRESEYVMGIGTYGRFWGAIPIVVSTYLLLFLTRQNAHRESRNSTFHGVYEFNSPNYPL